MAYARFRLAESMLESRAPRREAEAALADAHAAADRLGAAPLRGWIEGLARRARVQIREPEQRRRPTARGVLRGVAGGSGTTDEPGGRPTRPRSTGWA